MPDTRTHRGPHPQDARLFSPDHYATLQAAVADLSWLLGRGYAWKSGLKLVGDRHGLTQRQRTAVWRSACGGDALADRRDRARSPESLRGRPLAVDGYNLLITVESALGGGVILAGCDGCYRDLASLHGTYRRVDETLPAIMLIGEYLASLGVERAEWFLDSPVSNSGRLRGLLLEVAADRGWTWEAQLKQNPDRHLAACPHPVASTDSWVLDHCGQWVNLARGLIEACVPHARVIPLV
ncbi:MAG: DUF434 domain-containing protein [Phycisphaerales bacterium]|nr:MAG: DUF434 domain-containing protein [Phycisphaerales bacterium]